MTKEFKINRYSDTDLAEFKALIENKVAKTQAQLTALESQLTATAESKDNEGDWMDDSTINADIEMLEVMANRQRKHLIDLQNALQRIYNKSYGICIITGELIDKKRLLVVPTTSKSLVAKMIDGDAASKKPQKREVKPNASGPKIISRIIRKPEAKVIATKNWEDEEDLDLEIGEDLDLAMEVDIDFDESDLD